MRTIHRLFPVAAVTAMIALIAARSMRSRSDTICDEQRARVPETGSLFRFPAEPPTGPGTRRDRRGGLADGVRWHRPHAQPRRPRGVIQGPLAFTEMRLTFDNPEEPRPRGHVPHHAAAGRGDQPLRDGADGELAGGRGRREAGGAPRLRGLPPPQAGPGAARAGRGQRVLGAGVPDPGRTATRSSSSRTRRSWPPARRTRLPLRGLPKVAQARRAWSRAPATTRRCSAQIHLENAAPDRDLVVEPAKMRPGDGVRAGDLVAPARAAGAARSAPIRVKPAS